ncbi:MAG TPA: acyl-CoA dehydrogenase family protein [Acidimicrobiales bacterium]|nr:acyl-CoA dehydrogenase family protein [Acidimicrobiales bacterium]
MGLRETGEDAAFRAEARSWLRRHLPEGWADRSALRYSSAEEALKIRTWWQRELFDGGWAGLSWPEDYGGRGASLVQQVIFNEEAASLQAPEPINVIGLYMVGPTIIEWGTEEQKRRYLPPLLAAEEIWCQGFSEPDAGSDLASLRTRARFADDHYTVDGQKVWTSWAHVASFCMLLARTGDGDTKHGGLTVLIVDMDQAGVEVRPLVQITGDAEFNEVFFDGAVVPAEQLLGPEGEGWRVALTTLMHERGTMTYALQVASRILLDDLISAIRRSGLGRDPVTRDRVARIQLDLESLRLTNNRALPRIMEGTPGPEDSVRKLIWERVEQGIGELAMEIFGVAAQVNDGPHSLDDGVWPYQYLRGRARSIEAGTTEILKSVIAERALGLPRAR